MIDYYSWPKKTITTVLLVFFISGMNWQLQKLIDEVFEHFPYRVWLISEYSMHLCEKIFLLGMTLNFYFLADFKHKRK